MRGGRFGSKAGRVTVVVALVFGTLVAGTAAANAADLTQDDSAATTIGQTSQTLAHTLEQSWD
jgi:hypothetical protein